MNPVGECPADECPKGGAIDAEVDFATAEFSSDGDEEALAWKTP